MKQATTNYPPMTGEFLLFESQPGIAAAVLPDGPKFTVVAATNDFLRTAGVKKEDIIGKGHFEPFPAGRGGAEYSGANNIRAAFEHVLQHKKSFELPLHRHDIPNANGSFAERYWKALVTPALNETGEVQYMIYTAREVTAQVIAEKREAAHHELETAFKKIKESEHRFRSLVTAASDVIYRLSPDFREMYELKGKDSLSDTDEPVKDWFQKYVHPKDQQKVKETIGKAVETKTIFELEYQVLQQNGTLRWLFFRAIPIIDESENIIEWFGAASDITDLKETEEVLRLAKEETEKQKRVYETITGNTPDLIYVFDLNYRFTYANKALLEMWGKTWDEAIGKGLPENGYEQWHTEMHHREIDQVVSTRQSIRGEVSFPHAMLGRRIYDYIFVPVFNEDGIVEAVAGTTRDITEIKRAEESLRKSEQKQSFLLHLNDYLRTCNDPAEIQYEAARLVATNLGADRVGYAEEGGDKETVVVTTDYSNTLPSLKGRYKYDDYGSELIQSLSKGLTVVRGSISNDPSLTEAEKAAHAALRLEARVNVPLLRNGELISIFFMHFCEAHQWSAEEVALMQEVAERTWEAVVRARTEQALRESEERFRIMANAVPQSMWITDSEGRTEFLNRHWCDYCGEPYSDTTAADIAIKYLHPEDGPKVMHAFGKAMQTGEPFEVEQRNRSKDGEYRWFLNRATPYIDHKTGRVSKWFGVGVDIHDRKLAEEALRRSEEALEKKVHERTIELQQANKDLQRSNKNLEQFAYAASHDLKEPTRKIHVFVDRLENSLKDRMSETEVNYFQRIKVASSRMNTLIDDLLAYSELGQKAILEEEVNLNVIVERVLSDLDLEIEQKQATIHTDNLFTYKGNGRQMQQAFQNLIGNALKYSRSDVPTVVTISCKIVRGSTTKLSLTPEEQARNYYQISIKDNGIGFEQENAERIFNVFTRLHGMAEYKGTGVGLSIVRKVVRNHSGYVVAESQPNEGATFEILLPVI